MSPCTPIYPFFQVTHGLFPKASLIPSQAEGSLGCDFRIIPHPGDLTLVGPAWMVRPWEAGAALCTASDNSKMPLPVYVSQPHCRHHRDPGKTPARPVSGSPHPHRSSLPLLLPLQRVPYLQPPPTPTARWKRPLPAHFLPQPLWI